MKRPRNLPTTLFAMSAQEVGEKLGISRQRVNAITHSALKKIGRDKRLRELFLASIQLQQQRKHS